MTAKKNHTICDDVMKMSERGSAAALRFKKHGNWVTLSWQQYFNEIQTVASSLLSIDLKADDKVAIMSATRMEWSVCDYAILGLKAVTVPF